MTRSQFMALLVAPVLALRQKRKPSEYALRYAKAFYDGSKLHPYEVDEVGQWPSKPCHQGILHQIRENGKQLTYSSDIVIGDFDRVFKELEKQP